METQDKQNRQSLMGTINYIPTHKKCPSKNIIPKNSTSLPSNRSKLSTASFIKWLRSHFHSLLPKRYPYLYFPHELTRETSIEQIFVQFDADGSGGLSRDEVFDMFNGFGINITMGDLNQLYDSVEANLEQLNCEMFKKCALGQKSNKVFRQIVRKIQIQSDQQEKQYLPHNFTNMIIYLVYLSKRQELKQNIQKQKSSIQNKVESIETLLKLKDLSLNNERLTLHTETMKKHLRNKFRDIWQKVNQKYGQKFPYTTKMEEQFCNFYMKKQRKIQPSQTQIPTKNNIEKQPFKTKRQF